MGEILALPTLVDESNALSATSDSDVKHFHQAMRQRDAREFMNAASLEFQTLLDRNIVEILPAYKVPGGMQVFSTVWAMKRTQEVYKYKPRLNLDGSQMKLGKDYDLTYAPVASWESVRILLALVLSQKWTIKQLDYVLAFSQPPVERECYMKIPSVGRMGLESESQHLRQKQAGACGTNTCPQS
jgi:hypothetical protein